VDDYVMVKGEIALKYLRLFVFLAAFETRAAACLAVLI
jgi:hypothetical protein